MLSTHTLPAAGFAALAGGAGDSVVVRQLCDAQVSKHLMMLRVVADAADAVAPPSRASAAFRAGYGLLAKAQAADPGAVRRLLGLPHLGSWAHDCLASLDNGLPPDFGYLAAVAAAAAIPLGLPFELAVSVRDGRVPLPGLGCLELGGTEMDGTELTGEQQWISLSSDGRRLRVGEHVDLPCAGLVPDDGSREPVPYWRGTPLIRSQADGRTWDVLVETGDRYLDRYTLPMITAMTAAEVADWRRMTQAAWELLVRHHDWAAGPIAEGIPCVVPLVPRSDLDSATSPAAFGAIATSLPPSPLILAETLVHEFQHTKLCGLMDMVQLIGPCEARTYAPWREDPRPMSGLLQGIYAFAGIVRFWDVQRHLESEPDDILRAHVLYERWRLSLDPVIATLLAEAPLTPTGVKFVTLLREQVRCAESAPVPAAALEIAREVALDNWLTWQLRHVALEPAEIAELALAYQRGESAGRRALPAASLCDEIRKVDSIQRSRLLNMRYQHPRRFARLSTADLPELGPADALLIRGDARGALAAYRAALLEQPDPADWIGLALAVHRLPEIAPPAALDIHLPLLFELHACLAERGIQADPLDLAAWFE